MNLGEIGRVAAEHLLGAIGGAPRPSGVLTVPRGFVLREFSRANPA